MHYALGRYRFELRRYDEAISAGQSVNAFDADFGQARSGGVATYFEQGDFDPAWTAVRERRRPGGYVDSTRAPRLR